MLDLLAQLENKSLVICDRITGERPRFRLLEATRLYSREKLAEHADVERMRERHLQWCLEFAEAFESQIETNPRASMKLTNTEIDNLRAALEWDLLGSNLEACPSGIRIVVAMYRFWNLRGYILEEWNWLERGLARLSGNDAEAEYLRGRLLHAMGKNLLWWQRDARGKSVMEESIAILRKFLPMTGAVLPHGLAMLASWEEDPVLALAGSAYLAVLQTGPLRAGRLLGAAAAIVASLGQIFETVTAYTRFSYYRLLEMCRGEYDQAAWEEGYKMTVDQAIDYAVQGEK